MYFREERERMDASRHFMRNTNPDYKPFIVKRLMKKNFKKYGGGKESRTPDLLNAIQALYQLSYTPEHFLKRESIKPY